MRKAACWIVRQRRWILALTLILAAVCGVLIPGVQVNSDMTKYLPEDSQMRAGMRLMEAEFPAEEDTRTVRAMFGGLSPEQREKRLEELKKLPHVSSVTYAPDSPDYNQGDWALYVLTTEYGYDTPEEADFYEFMRALDMAQKALVGGNKTLVVSSDSPIAKIFSGQWGQAE